MQQPPIGLRFSQVYLERGKPTNDSPRMRKRLAEGLWQRIPNWEAVNKFGAYLALHTGMDVPRNGPYVEHDAKQLFLKGSLRDALDAITLFYEFSGDHGGWRDFVATVLREENVGYRVDEKCGVHYFVDEEFEHSHAATLAVLQLASLANARAAFHDAYRHLDNEPRDTKAAVRSMFEAAEIITKQICPTAQNLNRKLVEGELKQKCIATMAADATEQKALELLFDSLGQWVNALHNYRHGQAADEPVAPSEELAIYMLSTGSAHVRLLAGCFLRT